MGKKFNILLTLLLVLSVFSVKVFANAEKLEENILNKDVKIYAKGKLIEDNNVFVKDNRTFIPLQSISELFGYEVNWNNEMQSIDISKNSAKIHMEIGKETYKYNDSNKKMDVAPFIKDSLTFVPFRFIFETFGLDVKWDGNNRIVIVGDYLDNDLKLGKAQSFKINEDRFSLQFSERAKEKIGYELKENKIIFFDKYNRDTSKDKSSGNICSILKSVEPATLTVPGIILDYKDGIYTEVVFETGVEYSLEDKIFKDSYDDSIDLLKEIFKTYKSK